MSARAGCTGNRTTHAQQFLKAQGFTQVYNVKEGMVGSAAGPGWIKRGLPIVFDGYCVGGIGCGSGTSEQDEIFARAALAAVGAENLPE